MVGGPRRRSSGCLWKLGGTYDHPSKHTSGDPTSSSGPRDIMVALKSLMILYHTQ